MCNAGTPPDAQALSDSVKFAIQHRDSDIKSLKGHIESLQAENKRLEAVLLEFANDQDDCVSPGMKAKAIAAVESKCDT